MLCRTFRALRGRKKPLFLYEAMKRKPLNSDFMLKHVFLFTLTFFCAGLALSAQGLRILFIGDSITDGNWGNSDGSAVPSSARNLWDMNHIYGSGYMYLCASYYQSRYPEKRYRFFNRGISGNTLADLEKRWEEDAVALKPDVLSVLVGTNDVHYYIGSRISEPFDTTAWERRYRRLLDRAAEANPDLKIVLGTPFVAFTGPMKKSGDFARRDSLVKCLSRAVRRIASDYHAVCLPYDEMFGRLLGGEPADQDTYWIWDGIHPTPAGHRKMSELWMEKVERAGVLP